MRIAVIGTGISGMTVARLLCRDNDLVVFEANDYIGGHTHTVDVSLDGRDYAIDTGFIVHNDRTYPNFNRIIDDLGVERVATSMSFSVKCERTGLEYNGTSLNALFAQRTNLLRPAFWRMVFEILRFNREALRWLERGGGDETLGEFVRAGRFSRRMAEHYLVPMGAAIWSAASERFLEFPARSFLQFFKNHGLLKVRDRPQWYSTRGGSREYIGPLVAPYRDRIRLNAPVESVKRDEDGVEVKARGQDAERFDHVVFATHSDQALRALDPPSEPEREILGAIPYQRNEALLHTDESLLPRRRLAWAAWNYHILPEATRRVAVTYDMNILQRLEAPRTFCVTLNRREAIDERQLLGTFIYDHPVYNAEAFAAQTRHAEISGVDRIHYCGAYWGYGFHEDGVVSALRVGEFFDRKWGDDV